MASFHNHQQTQNQAGTQYVAGSIYNTINVHRQEHAQGSDELRAFGLCLGSAPQIEPDAFKGRQKELQQLREWLFPTNHPQQSCIVSIVGGMGKTQLSLAHARECAPGYSSVFWVNAKDATSVRQGVADLSTIIFPELAAAATHGAEDEAIAIERVRRWLSQPGNDQWLLIFDNYDDPHLPGLRSSTGYDIRPLFPMRSQGSILITTRSTKLAFNDGGDAATLARRLGGLPLALAATGTYLASAHVSCREYLDLYQSMWTELFGADAEELLEHEQRTQSSTWTISVNHVRAQHPDAAEFLSFFAFLSPRDIWYELLRGGAGDEVPWLSRVTSSPIRFQRAMTKLHDYSLVDMVAGSYQVHPCLQDWLVESLPTPPSPELFTSALSCVGESIGNSSDAPYWANGRRLVDHVEQLDSERFFQLWVFCGARNCVYGAIEAIAGLESDLDRYSHATLMYRRALAGKEKALGPDHASTLDTVNDLGNLYADQGKLEEAEQMYARALAGKEKALGPEHISTLSTVNNMGTLSCLQGHFSQAENMYQHALSGAKRALGPDHLHVLGTTNNLANLYCEQGKVFLAREMYEQAVCGITRFLGPDHSFISGITNNRGLLYAEQGEPDAAQQMYQQARDGFQPSLGSEHPHTRMVCYNIEQLSLTGAQTGVPIVSNAGQKSGVGRLRTRWYY